jgi:2-dehydropantoate 2-reductase
VKFAVVGAGSIGSFVGASLADAGYDVTLVGRGDHVAAMRAAGVEVRGVRRSFRVAVRATDVVADAGRVDYVLLTVKAHQVSLVAPLLGPLLHEETVVVTMQNGIPWWYFAFGAGPLAGAQLVSVDPGGAIAREIEARRVVGSAVFSGARLLAPGVVRQSGDLDYAFGEPAGGDSPRLARLVNACVQAGLDATADRDIRHTIWVKLLGNTTFNPISALTRATALEMVDDPAVSALVKRAMEEQIALGRQAAIDVSVSVDARVARTRLLGDQRTSMLQDVEAGRRLEIEPILGAVVEIADRLAAAIPATRALYALVRLLDRSLAEARASQAVEV